MKPYAHRGTAIGEQLTRKRRIGPIGTASRLLVAGGLLYLALFRGTAWHVTWYATTLGLAVLPGLMLAVALIARHRRDSPIHFTGTPGLTLNCIVIVVLLANHYTASGAELFYGATLIVAAWRAQPGCEATVLSNWILSRDDQIGCPCFTPIDQAEARHRTRNTHDCGRRAASPTTRS